jgi:hypothetical protein
MEPIIDRIVSHPLLSFVLALLSVLLLFAVLKGLIKIIIALLVVGLLYLGYVNFLQDEYPLPSVNEETIEKLNDWIEPIKSLDLNISSFDSNKSEYFPSILPEK